MKRTAFQRRCDRAWRKHWAEAYGLSVGLRDEEDVLSFGPPTNIYVIRDCETDAVKIGVAGEPLGRLAQLQAGNAHLLELVDWAPATLWTERFFHARLSGSRIRGEWFRPTVDVLIACELIMSAGDMRRALEDDLVRASVEDSFGMFCGSAERVDEWLQENPFQLRLDVADGLRVAA